MCFVYDEQADVWRERLRRARKPHKCKSCHRQIAAGDVYLDHFSCTRGDVDSIKICEACNYLRALMYAEEIAEGCEPFESLCWLSEVRDEARMRGYVSTDLGNRDDD